MTGCMEMDHTSTGRNIHGLVRVLVSRIFWRE
jgi:hypothetical protein